jgi:hypothetical protein
VNPADASDAVIERGLTAGLLFGIIPLLFVAIGGGGLYSLAVGRTPFTSAFLVSTTTSEKTYPKAVLTAEPATLRPRTGRGARLVAITGVALVWNAFLCVFLYSLLSDWSRGTLHWFLAVFLSPFILVGIVLVALAVSQALELFNPRPTVSVNRSIVALGDDLRVDWSMEGRVSRLARISITVEAREEATYTRGTDRITETNVFERLQLVNQAAPEITGRGSETVKIPADSMHSFTAKHNKVSWVVRVRGEVPRWPNSDDEFPLTVAPRRR